MSSKLLIIIKWSAIALLAVVLVSSILLGKRQSGLLKCSNVEVCIRDSAQNRFLTAPKVKSIIAREYGGCLNRPMDSINLYRLEKTLKREKSIRKAIAWKTPDRTLHVDIIQRTPVAGLKCEGQLLYLDAEGVVLKTSSDWAEGIIRIEGNIPVNDKEWTKRMAATAVWFVNRDKWNSRIDYIHCDSKGELTIHFNDRKELFLIGRPARSSIKERMEKIRTYEEGIAPNRESAYKSVNVKYKGQIICK